METKDVSANLETNLAGEVATWALCVKATRLDDQVFGFTTCDVDIPFESVTYEADSAFVSRTELASSAEMNVDDMEFSGVTSDAVTEADLRNGVWDNCEIRMFLVDYKNLADGDIKLGRGRLGNVTLGRYSFQAEMRRMLQAYSKTILRLLTPECDADFCDPRCGLEETDYRWRARVGSVTNNSTFVVEEYIEIVDTPLTITNPGFELGDTSSWTLETSATFAASSSSPRAGTYCGRITNVTPGDIVIIRQRIDLVAAGIPTDSIDAGDCDITIGLWSTNESFTTSVKVGIRYLDTAQVEISENYGSASQPADQPTYTQYSFEETAPALARYADVMFFGELPSGSTSKCKFDDATASARYLDYESGTPDEIVGLDTDQYFVWGWIEWLTGDNTGDRMEIILHTGATKEVVLFVASKYDISVDDEFYIYKGCDKIKTTCAGYSNVINFRGYPFLPLSDVLGYPDAQ